MSLALKNNPQIPAARRSEIQRVSEEMGYRPNSAAVAMSQFKQDSLTPPIQASLAWINAWARPERLRWVPEFDRCWTGAEQTAGQFGYRLEEFVVNETLSMMRLASILRARGVNGIIIPPHYEFDAAEWSAFPWEDFSVVRIGRSMTAVAAHTVARDQPANTNLAFQKAQEHGYKRIGFIGTNGLAHSATGTYLQLNANQPPARQVRPLLLKSALNFRDQDKVKDWLECEKPDVVLTDQNELAPILTKAGIRVPDDLGLIALNFVNYSTSACIDQRGAEIGRTAVLELLTLIRIHEQGIPAIAKEILIKSVWAEGDFLPFLKCSAASETLAVVDPADGV